MPTANTKLSSFAVSCSSCSLQDLCLPYGLAYQDIQKLETIIERQRPIKKGKYLFNTDQACNNIYAISSGSLKTIISTQQGEEQILGVHLPGELIGLDGLGNNAHQCSAQALETTSVCQIPLDKLEAISTEVPGLLHQVHNLIGKGIAADHQLLLLMGKKNAEERLVSFLLSLSTRLKNRGFSATEFNLPLSRQDIGNYLGLAIETVSRQFTKLQDKGIIAVERKHITIHQLDQLKQIANRMGTE